jgi:hypothetical protein
MAEAAAGLGRYWGVGGRRCGGGAAPAAVHCRTDGAYLCAGCDAAHARAGHERVWVCEVCERAPAAVACRPDAACDADVHDANPLARRHERVPVHPIVGSADAIALFAAAGEDFVVHAANKLDAKLDFLFADVMPDPFLGPADEMPRFPQADRVMPSNNVSSGGGAVELDFGGAVAAKANPSSYSYSSYTAHSVSCLPT